MTNINPRKDYIIVTVFVVLAAIFLAGTLTYLSFRENSIENSRNLQRATKNIETTITESFDYTNRINSYIGHRIAQHGADDLNFILKVFREVDKTKNRSTELFSWSSFDWLNEKNLQLVNSGIGIRKDPPDMSNRTYAKLAPQHPWSLQLSFPTIGNPSNIWVIPAGTGVVDDKGKYLGMVTVGFDVREFEARINNFLSTNINFIVIDLEGRVIMRSHEIGLEYKDNLLEKNFSFSNLENSQGSLKKSFQINDVEFDHYLRMSQYPYVILTGYNKGFSDYRFVTMILPRIGEIVLLTIFFLIVLYLFITRIKLLEREKTLRISLEKANKTKDKMLFSIAHDIKNQIFGIHGLSQLIVNKKTPQEISSNEDLQVVEAISDQLAEMMNFVKDLLDEDQLEEGEFSLGNIEKCQIKNLINNVILFSGKFALENYVEISSDIEDSMPELYCDPRRMKQIIFNLITNSIKYSRAGEYVMVSSRYDKADDEIVIEVKDRGYGMSKEDLEDYLAGRGNRIDKSKIKKDKQLSSHGIGMPIVLQLVELHQGKIEVESQRDVGTKVKVRFGVNALKEKYKPKRLELRQNYQVNEAVKSILMVEDNPINIKITAKILEDCGYKVSCAENGKEALRILDSEKFDLILMDGEMPIMNGYDATIAIRSGEVFKNFKDGKTIPIVALMSSADDKTIARAIASGMNDHVEKAISKTRLLNVITKYLS